MESGARVESQRRLLYWSRPQTHGHSETSRRTPGVLPCHQGYQGAGHRPACEE